MDDSSKVLSLLETLDDEVDDLEEALSPLLKAALSETSTKLPLLDKAKLYVLVTYAIESMLFSYLRLNGVKAREHPVFIELTRVKQYFDKIKVAETPVAERNMAVDKAAAARFIKAGLSGNDKYDLERAEQQAKERAKAHIRFEQTSKETPPKRKADEVEEADEDSDSSDSDSESSSQSPEAEPEESPPAPVVSEKNKKKKKDNSDSGQTSGNSTPQSMSKKARVKAAKKAKKEKLKAKRERKKQKLSSEQ
ncbi:Sas10/Utp3/C1D family-domain-containing protein [Hyaloscypha finlandica]|nr:Sas10/Utp3/C1D family-domain-containing protein [Hyaloscypha finlandica]